MRTWFVVALAIAACGKSDPKPEAAKTTEAPAKASAGSGSGSGSGSAVARRDKKKRVAPPPATAEQKATFKARMKAGWAQQKAKKWADAVPDFEAALVAIPADQRALAELGWSAMNAGDYKKAREADEQAVAIAIDSKVKASALFNLGTVQERTGDKTGALKSYVASLALRPNKTVEQAVGNLGADAKAVADAPACKPGKTPCSCMTEIVAEGDGSEDGTCGDSAIAVPPGLHAYTINVMHGTNEYLFDDANRFITEIAREYDHSITFRQAAADKVERRKVGTHDILWIAKTENDQEAEYEGGEQVDTSIEGTLVTICVLGDAKTPPRCPLEDVPQTRSITVGGENAKKVELSLDVGADGVVTIKLVGGASDGEIDGWIGPHKLW